MARPLKRTVDYFPHDCDATGKKTLTILQAKYGNDGYVFWFQLLELLGRTDGHYYCYQNVDDLEFLSAKTHQKDTLTVLSILETLVNLHAIDADLYQKKIIWSQNFVDRLADAYARTTFGTPNKPHVDDIIMVNATNKPVNVYTNPVNVDISAQTKLKETKIKSKEIYKEKKKESFEDYSKNLKSRFIDINWDDEYEKFDLYWFKGTKTCKNPKLALLNWMQKARYNSKGGNNGQNKSTTRSLPTVYTEPDELPTW